MTILRRRARLLVFSWLPAFPTYAQPTDRPVRLVSLHCFDEDLPRRAALMRKVLGKLVLKPSLDTP